MTSVNKSRNYKQTLCEKLAVIAGGGTVAAMAAGMPTVADADIVASSTTPIATPGAHATNFWDVDADGTNDFKLGSSWFAELGVTYQQAFLNDTNGGRLVVPAAANNFGISKLAAGVVVGTDLATAYKFHANRQTFNLINYVTDGLLYIGPGARSGGWELGDTGFFGFKFTSAAGTETFYGWGELTIFDDAAGFSINRAYYNNTAGASIDVGAVPEPSSGALFALGAAGLALYRRRKKAS